MQQEPVQKNPKVAATSVIWGCTIGIMGICIPLSAITNSGVVLPLATLLGATGGTLAVWFAPDQQQEEVRLAQTVKALEERVLNLETICRSGCDLQRSLPTADQSPNSSSSP